MKRRKFLYMISYSFFTFAAVHSMFCHKKPSPEYFNQTASVKTSKPGEIIEALAIKDGMMIADIGSGGGYFSYQFSERVGSQGLVYAVDISPDYLSYIQEQIQERGIQNINVILSAKDESRLPEKCCDLIFLRNVYHHLPSPTRYLKKIKAKLKTGGMIAIIDHKPADFFSLDFFSFVNLFHHYTDPKQIKLDMNIAGYQKINQFNFLKRQSFQIFKPR